MAITAYLDRHTIQFTLFTVKGMQKAEALGPIQGVIPAHSVDYGKMLVRMTALRGKRASPMPPGSV